MNSIATTPKKKRRWVLPVACTGALLAGVGMGATAQPEPEIVTEEVIVTETVTEEVEVEVPVVEEVEVEVETIVEVAPESCISAVEAGQTSIDLLFELNDYTMEGTEAASRMDVAGLDAATAKIVDMTPRMEDAGFDWGFWSEACKEAGE